jgi:BNR/Asp-box repeat
MKLTILVATWGDGLFAVTGETRRQEIANQPVRGLAPDGHGAALAIVGGHVLRRRAPNGEWITVATSEFELACCVAVGDVIYVGTDDARMLRVSQDAKLEPLESFDKVAGRDTWYAGSAIINGQRVGPPLGIRSVAADSTGTVLFANVHVGGIPRSRDGGKTWQPTVDINSDVHEVRVHQADPRIIVAATAIGLCMSRDFGETWAVEQEGLHAPYCSAVAFSGDDILVSASTDHFASKGRIYRRPIKTGGVLEAVQNGLPAWIDGIADTGCIATNGSKIAVADRSGNLYLSADFGHAWSRSIRDLPTPSGVLIC